MVSALVRPVLLGLLLLCGMLAPGLTPSQPHDGTDLHQHCSHQGEADLPCPDDTGCTGHLAHATLPDEAPRPPSWQSLTQGTRALDHRLPNAPDLAPDPPPIQAV